MKNSEDISEQLGNIDNTCLTSQTSDSKCDSAIYCGTNPCLSFRPELGLTT